jgi:hypothetical protein
MKYIYSVDGYFNVTVCSQLVRGNFIEVDGPAQARGRHIRTRFRRGYTLIIASAGPTFHQGAVSLLPTTTHVVIRVHIVGHSSGNLGASRCHPRRLEFPCHADNTLRPTGK